MAKQVQRQVAAKSSGSAAPTPLLNTPEHSPLVDLTPRQLWGELTQLADLEEHRSSFLSSEGQFSTGPVG